MPRGREEVKGFQVERAVQAKPPEEEPARGELQAAGPRDEKGHIDEARRVGADPPHSSAGSGLPRAQAGTGLGASLCALGSTSELCQSHEAPHPSPAGQRSPTPVAPGTGAPLRVWCLRVWGGAEAVVLVLGVAADMFTGLLLTSRCATRVLAGHGPVLVCGPGVGGPCYRGGCPSSP